MTYVTQPMRTEKATHIHFSSLPSEFLSSATYIVRLRPGMQRYPWVTHFLSVQGDIEETSVEYDYNVINCPQRPRLQVIVTKDRQIISKIHSKSSARKLC